MDQKNQRRFKNLLIFCLLLCLGVSNSVLAQDDDTDDEFTLEEIIVTAEKREAEVQKIPMDINVVRPNDMQRLGIHTVEDLDKILPDVQTGENAGSFVAVTIRNVTTNFWNPIHETTVAMHLDGVQLTRVNGFNNMFFDLQRLEVLKGPQGTLYGRGSTAGTMNIITQKPILNEFSGYATAELGNYDLQRYEAAINIPIVEKLSIRFAGRFFDHDGYNDSGYSNAHSWGGRVGMNWEPTDKDQIVATIDFEGFDDHGQGGSGSVFGTYGDLTIVPNTFNGTTIVQTLGPTKEIKLPWKSRWFSGNSVVDQAWNDNDSWGMMLQYNRDLSFAHTTIIYGHRSLNEDKSWIWGDPYLTWRSLNTNTLEYVYAPDDGDPTYQNSVWIELSDPTVWVDSITNAHFDSLEAHMTSQKTIAQGDRYEWMVGGLAQDDRLIEYDSGPMPSWVEMTTDTKAVFARATYSVFKDWNLKVGTRYSWDKKQYAGIRGTDDPHDGLNVYDFNYNYSDYMVNLSWVANDNIMSYLQYSKGTKTGNVDYNGNGVPPEILGAWETGLKSRFLNNRLQINGSAYFYDYKNYNEWSTAYKCIEYEGDPNDHICLDVASDPASAHAGGPDGDLDRWDHEYHYDVAVSPGGSEQIGLNINTIWNITSYDTLSATASWSKNEYVDYNLGNSILALYPDADNPYTDEDMQENRDGDEFGGSPIRGNITYSHMMFIGMDILDFNLMAKYEGKGIDITVNNNTDNEYTMPGVDEYWTLNCSISYESSRWVPGGWRWNARLWANNLMNSQFFNSISYSGNYSSSWYLANIPPNAGSYSAGFIQPRTMGLTLSVNF